MAAPKSAGRAATGPARTVPTEDVGLDLAFDADGLYSVRSSVAAHAAHLGASTEVVQQTLMVASELSTNAVRHGGGRGRLRLWAADGHLRCEVNDSGHGLADLASGTERPAPTAPGGRGLWLVRQLASDFALETGPTGTTVRVAITLDRDGDDTQISDRETG